MPGGGHGGHIVEHMAFRLLHRPKIGRHLLRLHDHLPQKHHPRAHNLTDHPHHAHYGMYLLQVPAGGAQFLPDIGHGVNAHNVYAPVGQIEKIVHHLVEYPGISVVQIPLIGVK